MVIVKFGKQILTLKVLLKNVPTLLKYTEHSAPKCTHLYEMYRKLAQNSIFMHLYGIYRINLIQRYTSFLKIDSILSGKMLPTLIKCTGNRTAKSYSL